MHRASLILQTCKLCRHCPGLASWALSYPPGFQPLRDCNPKTCGKHLSSTPQSQQEMFPVLQTTFAFSSALARKNCQTNRRLFEKVVELRAMVLSSEEKVTQMERSERKLTVRERIALLRDEGTEMLEVGLFAGLNMPYGNVLNASNTVAVATVAGELCVISANDWMFKGGTVYPISVKKQLRAQEIATRNRLPCIYLVDSGGAFLPLQAEIFPDRNHGGRVFRNQAVMSSLRIPQIAVVCGMCTAGGAYIPTMSDEAVMVRGVGTLYLGGPPLVKAATGESIGEEELGGADVHCGISGCADHYAWSEEEALQTTRAIVSSLNLPRNTARRTCSPVPPLYPASEEEFACLVPPHGFQDWPVMEIVARVVDGSRFHSFKEKYGHQLCAGFARINGHLVGLLASNGELTAAAALKGAHFVRLCSLRGIPLVFLQNTPSDAQFLSETGNDGATVKARAAMMASLACSPVPKITVVLGGSYGPSSIAMCGRAMEPNFLFAWPHARIAIAQPEHILQTLRSELGGDASEGGDGEELLQRLRSEELEYPSSNLVNDGVILPHETRNVLAQCLDICLRYQSPAPADANRLNVLRM